MHDPDPSRANIPKSSRFQNRRRRQPHDKSRSLFPPPSLPAQKSKDLIKPPSQHSARTSSSARCGATATANGVGTRPRRPRPPLANKMHNHQPSTKAIPKPMQTISIRHAIDSGIKRDGEKQDIRDHSHTPEAAGDARDHVACAESLDEEHKWHYGG